MKLKRKKLPGLIVACGVVLLLSGCDASVLKDAFKLNLGGDKKVEEKVETKTEAPAKKGQPELPDLKPEENEKIRTLVGQYLEKLYSKPPEAYYGDYASGNIPENVKEFVAKRTIVEGGGNPENGIHLPRIIEINGLDITSYRLLKYRNEKGEEVPEIDCSLIGKNGEAYVFFVKAAMKTGCLEDKTFSEAYQLDKAALKYTASAPVDGSKYDSIKVQIKYDFEIINEGGEFKILTAKETNNKFNYRNRFLKINNESVNRLPYLFTDGISAYDLHQVEEDQKTFDNEKMLIESFVKRIAQLDRNRMDLMRTEWEQGGLSGFVNRLQLPEDEKLPGKKLSDIMNVQSSYKNDFDISAFPLQVEMKRINAIENINVAQHPGYSEKKKIYFVKFDAQVEKNSGILNNRSTFRYDYTVYLSGSNDNLKVSAIKLNEIFGVEAKK